MARNAVPARPARRELASAIRRAGPIQIAPGGPRGGQEETHAPRELRHPRAGDGAGILVQIPHKFYAKLAAELGFTLPAPGQYAVGNLFMPRDPDWRQIKAQALARLDRTQRRDPNRIAGEKARVLELRAQLWQRLADVAHLDPQTLVAKRREIQRQVEQFQSSAGVLVAVCVDHVSEAEVIDRLRSHGGKDVEIADGVWHDGHWASFDPVSPPMLVNPEEEKASQA